MPTKKKLKKKTAKKVAVKKPVNMIKSNLLSKLKRIKMSQNKIAIILGYSSHNTIGNWFRAGKIPEHKFDEINRLIKNWF